MALSDILDIRVEFGLGAAGDSGSLWDTALWDEGVWSSNEISWTDMTSLVEEFSTRSGKSTASSTVLKRTRTASAVFTMDNTTGAFVPDGVSTPGFLTLRPGRYVRVLARPTHKPPVNIPDGTTWTDVTGRTWTARGSGMFKSQPQTGGTLKTFDFTFEYQVDNPQYTKNSLGTVSPDGLFDDGEIALFGSFGINWCVLTPVSGNSFAGFPASLPFDVDGFGTFDLPWSAVNSRYEGTVTGWRPFLEQSMTATVTIGVPGPTDWASIWYGRIDTIDNRHDRGDLTALVKCTDSFAELAVDSQVAVAAEGAGETASARITRILDRIGWPLDRRDIAPGGYTMQATTLAGDALELCGITTDSAGGDFWQKPDGVLAWRDQGWKSDTVDWIFGGLTGLPVHSVTPEWTSFRIVNEAHVSRAGGTEQIVSDSLSRATYGRRTHTRLDLVNDTDADVAQLGNLWVTALKQDQQIVTEVSVLAQDEATAEFMVGVSIGDLIQLSVDTIHGWSYTVLEHVSAISDDVTPEGWVMTLGLTPSTVPNEHGPYSRDEYSSAFHLGGEAP